MSQVYLPEHRGSTNWGDSKSNQHKSNQMLIFGERGKPEYPGKNLSGQSREPTNSTHIWRPIRESVEGQCSHHCANTALINPALLETLETIYFQTQEYFRKSLPLWSWLDLYSSKLHTLYVA